MCLQWTFGGCCEKKVETITVFEQEKEMKITNYLRSWRQERKTQRAILFQLFRISCVCVDGEWKWFSSVFSISTKKKTLDANENKTNKPRTKEKIFLEKTTKEKSFFEHYVP